MLDLSSIQLAVVTMDRVIEKTLDDQMMREQDDLLRKMIIAGAIQHFEFTYELCWKFMKRWLENNLGSAYVDGVSRRELFRLAAESRLIEDVERWMNFHQARNLTSHTYDEAIAQEVYKTAISFVEPAKRMLQQLEAHND